MKSLAPVGDSWILSWLWRFGVEWECNGWQVRRRAKRAAGNDGVRSLRNHLLQTLLGV